MSAKRFRIAFSFAAEKREFVARVADLLAKRFGEAAILYDKYHEAEFARRDLGIYLPELYHNESDLVVVVACANYDGKEWCGLEWTAIHDLLKQRKDDDVMLSHFDRATITGLYGTAGWIELDHKTPGQAADLILQRLALNEGKPKEHYKGSRPPSSLPTTSLSPTLQSATTTIQRTFACEFREFRGRSVELRELERGLLLDQKRTGVVIGAFGGMGKTALANQFCTAYGIEKFFDVIVGASAKEKSLDVSAFDSREGAVRPTDHSIRTVRDYLLAVAGQLGLRDPGARPNDKLEDEIRAAIDGTRALFLIDNLETLDETTAALGLLRRLCSPPGQKFLITARELPDAPERGVAALMLKRLEWEDARALVRDLLEDLDPGLAESLPDDNPAIAEVLKRADGHPLALRLLTGKLVAQGEKAILTMPDPLRPTGETGWGKEFFDFVFDEALLAQLGPIAVDVACVIASYARGVTENALAEACQASDPTITPQVLAEATRRLRLTFCVHHEHVQGEAVLAMHPLTREFFAGLANRDQPL